MLANDFGNEGLADGRFALGRKAPVEDMRNDPAGSRVGRKRLEADDFTTDPCRFGLGADRRAYRGTDPAMAARLAAQSAPANADQMQD